MISKCREGPSLTPAGDQSKIGGRSKQSPVNTRRDRQRIGRRCGIPRASALIDLQGGVGDFQVRHRDAMPVGPADQIADNMIGLDPRAALQITQHGSFERRASAGQQRTDRLDDLGCGSKTAPGGNRAAFIQRVGDEAGTVIGARNLAHARPHQARHRCERGEQRPLVPHRLDDLIAVARIELGFAHLCMERFRELALGGLARTLGQGVEGRTEVQDRAIGRQRDADVAGAAQHAFRTKRLIEDIEMAHAVEQRHDARLMSHRRTDRIDGGGEVVGFAAQDDRIIVGSYLARGHDRDRARDVAEHALDLQPVACEELGPLGPYEKGHVGACRGQKTAEKSARRTGTEHEYAHISSTSITLSGPNPAVSRLASPSGLALWPRPSYAASFRAAAKQAGGAAREMEMMPLRARASASAKVRRRLLPFLIVCYFAAYLDRVNVGFAALTMNADLGIGPEAFGFTAGIFFLGYCLFEVPSNVLLSKVGARLWIARIMITWGLVSAGMAFVTGTTSLSVMRFLLGVAEAGFFPGIIFYLTHWVPPSERAHVISTFMMAVPVSNLLGAPLSGLILDAMHGIGGLKGWQWLFLIEALPAILLGFAAYFVLTEKPQDADWLDADEKRGLVKAIEDETSVHAGSREVSLAAAFTDLRVIIFCIIYFGIVTSMYGLTLWMPQIVKAMNFSNTTTGLLTAIPYLFSAVAMVVWGRHSDQTGERIWHIAIPSLIGGLALICGTFVSGTWSAMILLTIASVGIFAALPMFWTLPTAILSGTAAAAGIALINSIGNTGGFIGPYLVGWLKGNGLSLETSVASLAAFIVISGVLVVIAGRRSSAHAVDTRP